MSINKQKYYTLINQEDDSIYIILKTIPTNSFEEVINTINFSDNFKKFSIVNNDDEVQIVKLKLFGAEILGLSDEELIEQLKENFDETLSSFNQQLQEKTTSFGLDKFSLSVGQNINNLDEKLGEFASEFNYSVGLIDFNKQ